MSYLEDNKRIATNTITLYVRTFFVMLVSLFTSRVLLNVLGVEDFGIYNLVGSIVVLFSFLNTAMTQAIQRFITIALGERNKIRLIKVFKVSLSCQLLIAIFSLAVIEPLGVWFLNNKFNVPEARLDAANWAFQLSMLTFVINAFRVPYDSVIIAYERMSFYAYIGILDSLLKLLLVLSIRHIGFDSLIIYTGLLTIESFFILIIYFIYCSNKYRSITHLGFSFEPSIFKEMLSFSGWSLFGSFTNVVTQKGFIFLVNIFFGVVANAAMGIANQVSGAVSTFVGSFQTSFRPQIVKAYATGNIVRLNNLVSRTSKFSFALMFLPCIFLIVNMSLILKIWLGTIPTYSIEFCQLILVCMIIDATTGPCNCAIMATGKIRSYQICISFNFLLDILGSYLLMKVGIGASYILIMRILTRGVLNMFVGLFFLKKLINFNLHSYTVNVLSPILLTVCIISPILWLANMFFDGWKLLTTSGIIILTVGMLLIYFVMFNKDERNYICLFVKQYIINREK